MVELTLPYPPSANTMWRSTRNQKSLYKSSAYVSWINACHAVIPFRLRDEIKGRFEVTITVDRPDRRKRDIDNLTKPILDVLKPTPKLKGVIEDDCLADQITIRWASDEPKKPAQVRITIEGK